MFKLTRNAVVRATDAVADFRIMNSFISGYLSAVSSFMFLTETNHPPINEYGEPLTLQYVNVNNEFFTNTKAINEIFLHEEVKDRKIVVLSIVGSFREGKSTFLNYCLRYLYANYKSINNPKGDAREKWMGFRNEPASGFSCKHGIEACTSGIVMWSDVFLHDTNDEKIAIVVMDTQGLFEPGKPAQENARIFGLSNCISSVLIYNLKNNIREHELEYLQMSTEFAKFVVNGEKCGESDISIKPFQSLKFLIRDFQDSKYEFGSIGGNKLLDKILNAKNDHNKVANQVRESIRESFENVECFLLPYPGLIVHNESFNGCWDKLEDQFITHLSELIPSLLGKDVLKKKTFLGTEVTGEIFHDYLMDFFEMFNSDKVPEVKTMYESTIDSRMRSINEKLLKGYTEKLNNFIDINDPDCLNKIELEQESIKATVLENFNSQSNMVKTDKKSEFHKLLVESIDQILNEKKTNMEIAFEAKKRADEAIKKAEQDKRSALKAKEATEALAEQEKNLHKAKEENFNPQLVFKDTQSHFRIAQHIPNNILQAKLTATTLKTVVKYYDRSPWVQFERFLSTILTSMCQVKNCIFSGKITRADFDLISLVFKERMKEIKEFKDKETDLFITIPREHSAFDAILSIDDTITTIIPNLVHWYGSGTPLQL